MLPGSGTEEEKFCEVIIPPLVDPPDPPEPPLPPSLSALTLPLLGLEELPAEK
jgi:hypothetical protein